ncbi:hypothetical protein AOLI_G00191330 [Acnodon oligacanthus]
MLLVFHVSEAWACAAVFSAASVSVTSRTTLRKQSPDNKENRASVSPSAAGEASALSSSSGWCLWLVRYLGEDTLAGVQSFRCEHSWINISTTPCDGLATCPGRVLPSAQ